MDKDIIRQAAEKVGGITKLSEALGLSRAAASQWDKVPPEHVLRMEQLTGVSRHILRPDVFGESPEHAA